VIVPRRDAISHPLNFRANRNFRPGCDPTTPLPTVRVLYVLLMLEDNAERLERFAGVLRAIDPTLQLRAWRGAHAMIREAAPLLSCAALISLDHDLEPEPGENDLGDGYMVAKWLEEVSKPVKCSEQTS
jgi:hypothetical protein